jgi:hypothetical protein
MVIEPLIWLNPRTHNQHFSVAAERRNGADFQEVNY